MTASRATNPYPRPHPRSRRRSLVSSSPLLHPRFFIHQSILPSLVSFGILVSSSRTRFHHLFSYPNHPIMSAKRPASPVQGPSAKKTRTAPAAAQENPSNPPIPPSDIPERVNLKYQFGGDKCKLNLILPPMYNIEDIFKSITEHAMRCGFKKFLDHMDSKPLRIATACSGTESPLLALQMVERRTLTALWCVVGEDADLT